MLNDRGLPIELLSPWSTLWTILASDFVIHVEFIMALVLALPDIQKNRELAHIHNDFLPDEVMLALTQPVSANKIPPVTREKSLNISTVRTPSSLEQISLSQGFEIITLTWLVVQWFLFYKNNIVIILVFKMDGYEPNHKGFTIYKVRKSVLYHKLFHFKEFIEQLQHIKMWG